MIQDISPKKLNNSFDPNKKAASNSLVLIHKNGDFLIKVNDEDKSLAFPYLKDFQDSSEMELVYLFSIDEEDFFLLQNQYAIASSLYPEGFDFCNMKQLRNYYLSPKHYIFAAFTALQLSEWYEGTVYCGKCGAKNENSKTERARVCPVCCKTVYPRINPAVIVGVTNEDKILLTKYKTGFAHNALVAGFTEIGETIEETVAREVMEETGINVKNIRYYKSQPWGIASDILMGFYCDVDGDDTITMDASELKYAQWVQREDIELQPLDYSLTNEMMKMFKEGQV